MVELPKTSPEEEIPSPWRRFPVVRPAETVEVSEELREEGVEEVLLPEERFEVSENGDLRSPEAKISVPGEKLTPEKAKTWLKMLLGRKRQKATV